MKLFLQKKCQIFERWGLCPQTPQAAPPLRISGYAPGNGGCLGGLGAEPPALKNFAFFCKNNLILDILIKNNAFKMGHRNWQRKMIQQVALMGYVVSG